MKTMKGSGFISAAAAVAAGLAMLAAPSEIKAQQASSDRFNITLSHPVTIGNKILQPGNYSLEPLTLAGGDAPVLSISSVGANYGLKFQTTAMIVPTLENFNRIQPETRVFLRHIGRRYYFDRIWVKGQEYGYDFPLPKGLKGRGTEVE
jgi:hypothetical protein